MKRGRILRSTTTRLFVPVAIVQIAAAAAMLGFVWLSGQQGLRREHDALVDELRDDLISDYNEGGIPHLREVIALRMVTEGQRAPIMVLVDPAGRQIAGNLAGWRVPAGSRDVRQAIVARRAGSDQPEDMALRTDRLPGGYRLIAGWATGDEARLRKSFGQALVLALMLSIPLSLLVALLISRSISNRIRHFTETAQRIGTGALDARVPLDGSGDSFDELGATINEMLERIEGLIDELRLVTDGLAHDLRSPVTRLKSLIERAAREIDDPAALATLDRVAVEAEALMAMLATALQITRVEAGIGRDRFVETDLGEVLSDMAELYSPLADERGFVLTSQSPPGLMVRLNRELISQAIGNLIDNALKYADGGSRIRLSAAMEGGEAVISVCDDGPGIPAGQRAEAVRRFGRLDPARGITGSGLGLSLAEAVARLHRGRLELDDAAPGLCVRMILAPDP